MQNSSIALLHKVLPCVLNPGLQFTLDVVNCQKNDSLKHAFKIPSAGSKGISQVGYDLSYSILYAVLVDRSIFLHVCPYNLAHNSLKVRN